MLTRISLIVVILAGIGALVFGQMQVKQKIDETIAKRDTNYKSWKEQEARANGLDKQLAATKEELAAKVTELAKALEALGVKDQEIARLNGDLGRSQANLRDARAERDRALAKLQQYELTGLQPDEIKEVIARLKKSLEDIKGLEAVVVDRNRDIAGLKARIEDLIGGDAPVILPAGLKGKIVTVDPKWDFVVINLGKSNGLLVNGQMLVSRNGKLLAKVKIVNVMEDKAIANVLSGWKLDDILEGDTVLY